MESDNNYLRKELYSLMQKDPSIFEFLQEASLDGLWYWDLENQENEWMNARFWKVLGYDPSEKKHLSSEWQDLIFPEDLQVAIDNFNKHCSNSDHPYDQIVRYRHKDGSTVWVRCRGMAIRDKDGKPVRMLGAHTELTKQKEAEEKYHRFADILSKRVRELNCLYSISKLLENSVDSIDTLLQDIVKLMPPAWLYPEKTSARIIFQQKEYTTVGFKESPWKQSKDIHVHDEVVGGIEVFCHEKHRNDEGPFLKEEHDLINIIAENISRYIERIQAENELKKTHEKLERMVRQRTAELHKTNIQLGKELQERKLTENALKESEEQFRSTFEQAAVGIAHVDLSGQFLQVNHKFCEILGYTRKEMLGMSFHEITHPDDLAYDLENLQKLISGEIALYSREKRYIKKDGRLLWGNLTLSLVRGPSGTPKYFIPVLEEITARKKLEEDRDRIWNLSRDFICVAGMDGFFKYLNPAWEKNLGYTREELLAKPFFDFIHLDDKEKTKREVESLAAGKITIDFENRYIAKDGLFHDISWTITPLVSERLMYCIGRDITESKNAEADLKRERDFSRSLIATAQAVILVLNPDGTIRSINPYMEEICGYRLKEVKGKDWFETFVPDYDRQRVHTLFDQAINDIQTKGNVNPIITKDEQEVYIEWYDKTLKNQDGQTVGLLVIGQDVTERKRTEEQLYFMKNAVDGSSDSAFWSVESGRLVYVNDTACRGLGYSREELLAMTVWDFSPNITPKKWGLFWQDLKDKRAVKMETVHQARDGKRINVEVLDTLIEYDGREYNCSFVRDITDRVRAEEERQLLESRLQQVQKMEAIGTLAGGIAHDFNNILMAIFGYAGMVQMELEPGSDLWKKQQEVINAGKRARDLVKQILTFSRQAKVERQPLQVHLIVKEALKLLRASIPTIIDIHEKIVTTDDFVLADSTQIHQIVMNLCTNAYQSMRETGGSLTVELFQVDVEQQSPLFRNGDLPAGPYLVLKIMDTGCGMDRLTQGRIFEPFFTTKFKEKGIGMGLAVVHGIIKSYGGYINVQSLQGKGTTFEVYLPRILSSTESREQLVDDTIPKGDERILVVDDDQVIVQMEKKMLENFGYKVTAFVSCEEALKAFNSSPEGFDLVITDMTMPHMTGAELSQRLMDIRPDIPVIMCTGFSELINEEKAKALGIKEFIMKPIVRGELANAVRKALGN